MLSLFIEYIFLILIILALVMLAGKLRIAYPIVLVMGGLALSFVSGFSNITIDPEYVFFLFLPPLLYEAAWQTSWKEFWKWRRVISSFAFLIVILTSCVIAFTSSALIPGFTLALGFLLGGIISPPDAISATTIMRQLKVPKSLVCIIEGESLLNDASSLIIVRFAVVAIITGQFYFQDAALSFFLVIILGCLIGIAVAWIFYCIHRWLPTTSSIDTILTLITPYCMYYAAEQFHYSGVLAVVCGGLLLSSKRQQMLSYKSRIQGVNVWTNLVFVLNGLIFMLIGLQLRAVSKQLGEISVAKAIGYGLLISAILIITRVLFTMGTSVFTRFASRFITVADSNPGWKMPLITGWAGMRGVVSLAAALSIPVVMSNGQPFPFRNLILFITFIVILVTLVFQGLTLPWLVRKLAPEDKFTAIPEAKQEFIIQRKIARQSIKFLQARFKETGFDNKQVDNLFTKLELEYSFFDREFEEISLQDHQSLQHYYGVYLDMLVQQRKLLAEMNRRSEFDEDLIRKYLSLTDLEELKVREKLSKD